MPQCSNAPFGPPIGAFLQPHKPQLSFSKAFYSKKKSLQLILDQIWSSSPSLSPPTVEGHFNRGDCIHDNTFDGVLCLQLDFDLTHLLFTDLVREIQHNGFIFKRKDIESLLGGHEIGYYKCKHIREDWLYT
jgi:hypothetical protein